MSKNTHDNKNNGTVTPKTDHTKDIDPDTHMTGGVLDTDDGDTEDND